MALCRALERVGAGLGQDNVPQTALDTVIAGLGELPLALFDRVVREVVWRGRLHRQPAVIRETAGLWSLARFGLRDRGRGQLDQLERKPDLAYLLLFHGDGHLRQAALERMSDPLPSPFFLVALVYRLNDWVPQVRAAAAAALARVGPATTVPAISEAMLFLLPRTDEWGRWLDQIAAFEALLARPDVAEMLADRIGTAITGPMARVLRHALRRPAMDAHLLRLAREGRQPAVRALALTVLTEGEARWPVGLRTEKKWIDKSMGRYVLVRQERTRPITHPIPIEELIEIGARDKAAPVRLAAATALARHFDAIPDGRRRAEALAEDKNRSVRERAAYLLR